MKKNLQNEASENKMEGDAHKGELTQFWSTPKAPCSSLKVNYISEKPKEFRDTIQNLLSEGEVVIVSNFDMRLKK